MVAAHLFVPQVGNAFSLQADFGVRLGSGLHIINNLAVHRINNYLAAKSRYGKGYRNRGIDIVILALEYGMTPYNDFYKHISPGAAVDARFSHASQTLALAVVDSRRDIHLKPFLHGYITASMAVSTFIFNYLAGAVTVRTGLYIADRAKEGLLGKYHLALTAALGTGNGLCTLLGSRSVTGLTFFLYIQFYGLRCTEYRFFEGYVHTGTKIGALHGCIARPAASAGSAAEEITKYITENIAKICAVEIKAAEAAATCAVVKGCMAELVVLAPFLRITQYRICLRCFLKFLFRLRISRVHIRMVFFGEDSVCFLNGCVVSILLNA